MTINKAIELADSLRPGPVSEMRKANWLIGFETRLIKELGGEPEKLVYPMDGDRELSVCPEYGEIYVLYLCSMVDFAIREYEAYNSEAVMLNSMVEEYKKQYLRDNLPPKRKLGGEVWRADR